MKTTRSRVALGVFAAVEVVAGILILRWGRDQWFFIDDWAFLAYRTANPGDIFRPHFQHWASLPFVAYRFLWWLVGLRSYAAYQALVVVAHLGVAALLRVVMRRAGVGPWLATAFAGLFVFFGSGAENIIVAFQVTFVGALAFGLLQLVLADHDGPVDRRDWYALAAGLAALMCSGVAITVIAVVGLTMLLRRGGRVAALQTVPLAVVYLIWLVAAPEGQTTDSYHANSLGEVVRFTAIGVQAMFGGLAAWRGAGFVGAVVLVVGIGVLVRRNGRAVLRGPATASLALLVGAVVFLVVTGMFRAGQGGFLVYFARSGVERARQSRYVYIVAALALPALALAVNALIEYKRRLAIAIAALLAFAIAGNVDRLRSFQTAHAPRPLVLAAPRLPIATRLPPAVEVSPNLPLGWLLDNLDSGRIPAGPVLSPREAATVTLQLALAPAPPTMRQTEPCATLTEPTIRDLAPGAGLTVRSGRALVAYLPLDSVASRKIPLMPPNVVALVPMRVSIEPVTGSIVLCG